MKLTKNNVLLIALICFVILSLSLFLGINDIAYAKTEIDLEDGKYELSFDTTMPSMGLGAFENKAKKVVLEKIGKKYYITVSTDMTQVSDVKLLSSKGKVGETVIVDGNIERHTYSIYEKDLGKEMNFSMFVKAMNKVSYPNITPILSSARRIGDVNIDFDRPAEYVPEITVNASNNELEKGSTYVIPQATAKIGNSSLIVLTKAYYMDKGAKVEIDITSGSFVLNKVGEYHVVYHAESDKYKTLKGNNTIAEIDITLIAKVGATSIVKVEDKENLLPEKYSIQSSYITEGEVFNKAKNSIAKIADNFEVIKWNLLDKTGENIVLENNVGIFLRCNDAYNKDKVLVYLMNDDGSLTKVACENYGRYVKINTKTPGTYIVCQEGVEFHMPMWGIALITIISVLIVIAIIILIVVIIKKKNVSTHTNNKADKKKVKKLKK